VFNYNYGGEEMNETPEVDKFMLMPYKKPLLGEDLLGGGKKWAEDLGNLDSKINCIIYWHILMKTPVYSPFVLAIPSGIRSEPESKALPDKSSLGKGPSGFTFKVTSIINQDFMFILNKALRESCPWADDMKVKIDKIQEEFRKKRDRLEKTKR